ncbi:MAG TPA: bifunctional [glutamate--ammonia ligase]-adenylyl-L-tyrosine phosphorylase/[glutamate--ammonia-ligase] adenylyltransferase [Gammaproteobacteria bacterium]|nr:bifunctional [glutamate--ammonia ligase]-adenylyl-L-tyrosine phosphorylase/[glutamate--ammonia-ligase] adenylyltransferase [Gammaproteobacteria bacterium]
MANLPDVPPELTARAARAAERLAGLPVDAAVLATAQRVGLASDFVLDVLARFPPELAARLEDRERLARPALEARLELGDSSEAAAMTQLRRIRQIEMARIAWRDLAGLADVDTILAETSLLADCIIEAAAAYAARQLEPRFPAPRDAAGKALPLLVLAMGKLGGGELNFSSDVDLVFLHPDVGAQPETVEAEQHYLRLAQLIIKLLDSNTADGFAYRVDTRLRPFGQSGPLVVSLAAFEAYLLQHGRDWERYAYVKARLLTGLEHSADVFDEILTPFVYRRYLDFGVFDALRQMKRLISKEVARKDMAENIKLGPGGIREIEFIVQAFQLVRGGRNPELRTRSLLTALPLLASDRQLRDVTVTQLAAAYRVLRTLENRLQAMDDRQTHDLPDGAEERARLAYALGEPAWDALYARLRAQRTLVESQFDKIAWEVEGRGGREVVPATAAWEAGEPEAMLAGTPLAGNADIAALLGDLRRGALHQRMDEVARQRLAAVMTRTMQLVASHEAPLASLERVLPVYRAICRRSAYLALLNENPAALERLLNLVGQSAWLARQIAEHPMLLDELLDARIFDAPPTREELAELFERTLRNADKNDAEATIEAIRVFQRTAIFRIALADRLGSLPLMKVSDRLTDTAELVLDFSLHTAWRELTAKYGIPFCGPPPREAGFAVIGYGKLGGLELGYGSDLDLVFVHDSSGAQQETNGTPPVENERFFARLVQRLIHFLTIQTSSGRLYEVDTRLRPSGRSGLLVTSLEGFRRYQVEEAWVWEHQALLRSRALAGARRICTAFESVRREILTAHVNRAKLAPEVVKMRRRMRAELSLAKRAGGFDLKQDPGGIADIEFLVDYWVLASSAQYPELVEYPDNVRQLEALERVGLVPADRCRRMKDAYLALRQRVHELALDEAGRVVGEDEFRDLRAWVVSVWDEVFAGVEPVDEATTPRA